MKKLLTLTALLLAVLILAGCAKTPKPQDILNDILRGQSDQISDIIGGVIGGDDDPKLPGRDKDDPYWDEDDPAEPYFEFTEWKNELISNINQTIYMDPDLGFEFDPSLVNIFEVDAVMWPSAMVWDDEEGIESFYAMMGYGDIKVDRKKDGAVVTYTKDNGSKVTFTGIMDEDDAHFKFDSLQDNGDHPYLELVRTAYGYAAQYYTGGLGMVNNLYLITVNGEDGMIGIVHDTERPEPLTRNLSYDFPMDAGEWYHYSNGKLTGVSRSGDSFEGQK